MSYMHGKDTVITVDGKEVKANTSTLTRGHDSHDTSGYGDDDHTFQAGQGNHSFSMGGIYENNTTTGSHAILRPLADTGLTVAVTRKPEGTGSGRPLESFDAFITSYVETNPVGDMVTWTCDMQISGAITSTSQ